LNARSKSFGSGDASTSRAIATNRLWRSASVSLGFVCDFRDILFSGKDIAARAPDKPRNERRDYEPQSNPKSIAPGIPFRHPHKNTERQYHPGRDTAKPIKNVSKPREHVEKRP